MQNKLLFVQPFSAHTGLRYQGIEHPSRLGAPVVAYITLKLLIPQKRISQMTSPLFKLKQETT